MKSILFSLLTILFLNSAISQTQIAPPQIAKVSSEIINTDTIQYTFVSNYYISDYKAPILAGRLLDRYPEIIEINIDSQTQTIVYKSLSTNSTMFLEKFVKHFKYSGYEIH